MAKVTFKMNPGAIRKLEQQVKNSPGFKKMEADLNAEFRAFLESLRGRPRAEIDSEIRRYMAERNITPNEPELAKLIDELAPE